jgi:hypothetical protein
MIYPATVTRSPDEVKCNAATPADNSAPSRSAVLSMAGNAL